MLTHRKICSNLQNFSLKRILKYFVDNTYEFVDFLFQVKFLWNVRLFACIFTLFYVISTECPTDVETHSNSIFYFLKSHMSKSNPWLEILGIQAFRWHLETFIYQKTYLGGVGGRWWEGEAGNIFFLEIDTFFWYSF